MPPLSFTGVQQLEAAAAPPRAASDPQAVRDSLIASGVLHPAVPGVELLRLGTFTTDAAGIADAAKGIMASGLGPMRLAAVVQQADPRVASKLRELAALRGVQLAEAA